MMIQLSCFLHCDGQHSVTEEGEKNKQTNNKTNSSPEGRNYPQWMHFLSTFRLKDELRSGEQGD